MHNTCGILNSVHIRSEICCLKSEIMAPKLSKTGKRKQDFKREYTMKWPFIVEFTRDLIRVDPTSVLRQEELSILLKLII